MKPFHRGFTVHLLSDSDCWACFNELLGFLNILLRKVSVLSILLLV